MFPHHSLIPWGSFRGRQEEKWGSFRGRFGDHFRVGDHFGVGIISGAVQTSSELLPEPCYQPEILSIIPLQSNVLRVKYSEVLKATSIVTNHAKTQNV